MFIPEPDATTDVIGQPLLGTNVRKQPRPEATAEDLVHHLDRVVIRVFARRPKLHQVNRALVHFLFRHEEQPWPRRNKAQLWRHQLLTLRQAPELLTKQRRHLCRIEVPRHTDDHVPRVNELRLAQQLHRQPKHIREVIFQTVNRQRHLRRLTSGFHRRRA